MYEKPKRSQMSFSSRPTCSGILFIVPVGSMFDYPARTPMFMALLVVAAAWLSDAGAPPDAGGESMRIRRSMRTT